MKQVEDLEVEDFINAGFESRNVNDDFTKTNIFRKEQVSELKRMEYEIDKQLDSMR